MHEVVAVKKWQIIDRREWLGRREELHHERRGMPAFMHKPPKHGIIHVRIGDYCG